MGQMGPTLYRSAIGGLVHDPADVSEAPWDPPSPILSMGKPSIHTDPYGWFMTLLYKDYAT